MNEKILTPTQLWKDFDNHCCPLDMSIIDYRVEGDISIAEYYFTALNTEDGNVRVFVRSYSKRGSSPSPAMMIVHPYDRETSQDIINMFVDNGYAVITFDYKGDMEQKTCFTQYPPSLSYGNILMAGDHLDTPNHGVDKTCGYLWAQVTRRVITFIEDLPICEKDKIFAFADDTGFNILAQVAGTDERLKGIIDLRNNGFDPFNVPVVKENETLSIEQEMLQNRWSISCTAPSYIKFISCPILYFTPSNDIKYDITNLKEMIAIVPNNTPLYLSVSVGTSTCLYDTFVPTAIKVLESIQNDWHMIPPSITRSINNSKVSYSIDVDESYVDIQSVVLCVAYGEQCNRLRGWNRTEVKRAEHGKYTENIKVYDLSKSVYAMAVVQYANGVMLSTPIDCWQPSDLAEEIKLNIPNNRIIYQNKSGVMPFFANKDCLTVDQTHIHMAKGALDIDGITTDSGSMTCYCVADISTSGVDTILQFDCYTLDERNITITLQDSELNCYTAELAIPGDKEWQRFSLTYSMFKDMSKSALKSFSDIKLLTFSGLDNALLNNIIWI